MNKKILIASIIIAIIASVSIAVAFNETDNLTATNEDTAPEEIEIKEDVLKSSGEKEDLKLSNDNDNDADKISSKDNDKLSEEQIITQVTVKKVWDDNNNADGKRPSSVKFNLSVSGDYIGTYELKEGEWQTTVKDLHIAEDQTLTVEEESVDGYTTKVTGDGKSGFTITNTLENKNNQTTPDDDEDDNHDDNQDDGQDDTDDTPQKESVKKTTKTVKKTPKKVKDKHKTGYPVLLALLALSGAGLAVQLRRKE